MEIPADYMTLLQMAVSLISGGGLASLFLLNGRKKKEELENERIKIDNEKGIVEAFQQLSDKLNERNQQLSDRYEKKNDYCSQLHVQINSTQEQIAKLKAENIKLAIFKCDRIECPNRKPPMTLDDNI